jgi:hypothetical protein
MENQIEYNDFKERFKKRFSRYSYLCKLLDEDKMEEFEKQFKHFFLTKLGSFANIIENVTAHKADKEDLNFISSDAVAAAVLFMEWCKISGKTLEQIFSTP